MKKKILIAVGGTGGHIFPALSFAKKFLKDHSDFHIEFAGGGLSSSRFFSQNEYPYKDILCGSLPLKKPFTCLKNLAKIFIGTLQSFLLIKKVSPKIIVGFGSYHSLPILIAARLFGIPMILHESNAIPGKVNRLFAKNSKVVGISFPTAANFLKGKSILVKMPLREGFNKEKLSKEEALKYFHLNVSKKTLLIFGGSQGATSLNRLIIDLLKCYNGNLLGIQIIHLVGSEKDVQFFKEIYNKLALSHCVKAFETNMEKAWSAADLVICRAGAGTIAEALEFEIPSIFIPYPFATDDHQTFNASYIVNIVKGAYLFQERDNLKVLADLLYDLMEMNPKKLESLKTNLKNYKEKRETQELSSLVTQFIS